MAQLSKIVSSILRDMVLAQHEANMYALELAEPYRKNGNLPLPAVALGEMELEIKYGVLDASAQEEHSEIDYRKLRKVMAKISSDLARVCISSVVSTVLSSSLESDPPQDNLIEKLDKENDLQRKFSTFLSHKLLAELLDEADSLVKGNGKLNEAVICDVAFKVGKDAVLYHQELESLFAMEHGEAVREQAGNDLRASIGGILPHLTRNINVRYTQLLPSLNVVISSEELSKWPEESIHLFRFKVGPRDLRINLEKGDTSYTKTREE